MTTTSLTDTPAAVSGGALGIGRASLSTLPVGGSRRDALTSTEGGAGARHRDRWRRDQGGRRELEVNLLGMILGSRPALQRMLARRHGHLVNIASGVGCIPLAG